MPLTFVPLPDHPRSLDAILADVRYNHMQEVSDRIAAEDMAWRKAAPHLRRHDAGHRCLFVTRDGAPELVPLSDLTEVEIDVLTGVA